MEKTIKKVLATILVVLNIFVCFAQDNTIKHTVDKGETLASIAKRYDTTKEKIIELNPDAAQFIYVGMELTIPTSVTQTNNIVIATVKETKTTTEHSRFDSDYTMEYPASAHNNVDNDVPFMKGKVKGGYEIVYYFPEKKSSFGMAFDLLANYYIINRVHMGAGVGIFYTSSSSSKYETGIDFESTSTALRVPFSIGYTLPISNDKIALGIKTGPSLHWIIGGKQKLNDETIKFKDMDIKRFSAIWDIGINLYFYGFGVKFGYSASLSNGGGGQIGIGLCGMF